MWMSDYDEMLRVAETRENSVEAAFKKYDADNSGAIEDTEVMCLLQDLGKLPKTDPSDFLASVFTKYDADNNGVLTFEEFKGFYNAAVLDANGRGFSTSIPTTVRRITSNHARPRLAPRPRYSLASPRCSALGLA